MNRATWKLVRRMNCQRLASAAKATNAATSLAARRSGRASVCINSQMASIRTSVRHASPNSNRLLKPMFFHAPVERPTAQPQLGCGKGDIEMMHSQGTFDHLPFKLVEVEAPRCQRQRRPLVSLRKREIVQPICCT